MQTDTAVTCTVSFFLSVMTWMKMLEYKKQKFHDNNQNYVLSKIDNLECKINNNKTSILNIDNQLYFIDEALFDIKKTIRFTINRVETLSKVNNNIDDILSQFEILFNEKLYTLEERIHKLEKKTLHENEKFSLKIINPEIFVTENLSLYNKECKSPYSIMYTSSSVSASSNFSPARHNEWVNLPCKPYDV